MKNLVKLDVAHTKKTKYVHNVWDQGWLSLKLLEAMS